jgi:two-component sensor histidine kinase
MDFPYIGLLPIDQVTCMNDNPVSRLNEQALRGNQQQAIQIINQMPFPVEVCDPQGATMMVNKSFLDTFEVPPAGRTMEYLAKHGFAAVLEKIHAEKKATTIELTVEPGDLARTFGAQERPVMFETTLYPVLSPHGEVQQIVALWKDVTVQSQTESQMIMSLQEKEMLLKEIHHRVKNNLQVICSLLSLQGGAAREPEVRKLFDETLDRVRSMASIHQMLYHSTDMARVDFSRYINTLADQLFSSYSTTAERIELKIEAEPVSLGINLGIPCGLLINELMTNSLKHAFPGGRAGTITVSVSEMQDHSIRLSVSDDGIGLPPDLDVENAETLGLQLVMTLVGQLNGTLEVRRERGTEFVVLF